MRAYPCLVASPLRFAVRAPLVIRGAAAAVLALGPGAPAPAAAQAPAGPRAPAPRVREGDWMVSVNPFGLLSGGLTAEAERRLGDDRTGAVAVNHWGGYGGWSYTSLDVKLRFYRRAAGAGGTTVAITNTRATDFEALSYGPMLGFQRVWADVCPQVCSATGLTAGGTVDYGWRLGKEKQFAALAGVGVKTGFGFGELGTARVTYPFVRLGVGYVLAKGR
jgi:hypothetical protein